MYVRGNVFMYEWMDGWMNKRFYACMYVCMNLTNYKHCSNKLEKYIG